MTSAFLLVQFSDPHIGARWADTDPVAGLAAAVETVRRLGDHPDAVLVSGDLTDDAAAEGYERVRELVSVLGAPVYVLPGNHDDRDGVRRCFDLPGESGAPVQYAVDLGLLRLVVLDSTRPGADYGELDAQRLAWLDAELAAAPDQVTLLAMHHPPLSTGSPAWDRVGLPAVDRRALGDVLERHPQVRRIVAGHMHRTITAELAGRAVLAVPSTFVQAELSFSADQIKFVVAPCGYAVHALLDSELASHIQAVG
jgi:3',5'-cyclic AMP phosphodiesterase CpdA